MDRRRFLGISFILPLIAPFLNGTTVKVQTVQIEGWILKRSDIVEGKL